MWHNFTKTSNKLSEIPKGVDMPLFSSLFEAPSYTDCYNCK